LRGRAAVRLAAVAAALAPAGCERDGGAARPDASPEGFADVTAASGVDFLHRRCGAGEKQLVEINAGGVSVLDFDLDGKLDLYFPQGAPMPGFDATGVDLRDRLFRGLGGRRFADVTDATGCSEAGFTYHGAAADYDGDGDPDLFLSNFGCNRLLRNDLAPDGSRRFVDVTEEAGVADRLWSTCAAFADFDRDGDLDLYVGNYVLYDERHPLWCGDQGKGAKWRSYCHPDEFRGAPDQLLRNDGNGRFTDVTRAAGLDHADGKCLGLLVLDYDDDGDCDLYVANDSTPNFLWRNDTQAGGPMRFENVADDAGCALGAGGLAQASMGVDAADVDGDGHFDVAVTNLALQGTTLYQGDGRGFFRDGSMSSGLGPVSLPFVGFGLRFFDVDLDGDEDVVVVNGHVIDNIELYKSGQRFEQPSHLFLNDGAGRFRLAGAEAGSWFGRRRVGRAVATLDVDDDGDLDLVVAENDGRASLLENRMGAGRSWLGVRLVGAGANTAAIGARVRVTAGGRVQMREQRGTCSYGSFVDLRIHFGLADADVADLVEVRWPTGATTRLERVQARRYVTMVEPGARTADAAPGTRR
jgi:hypothetical protein